MADESNYMKLEIYKRFFYVNDFYLQFLNHFFQIQYLICRNKLPLLLSLNYIFRRCLMQTYKMSPKCQS